MCRLGGFLFGVSAFQPGGCFLLLFLPRLQFLSLLVLPSKTLVGQDLNAGSGVWMHLVMTELFFSL